MGQTISQASCAHCGTLFIGSSHQSFCCSGCEFVYQLLHNQGLAQFYALKDANPPACPAPVQMSSATYDFCDDLQFIQKLSPDGRRLRFYLEGMNCTACLWLLEKLPQFCSDAESARVNLSDSTIEVRRHENASFAKIAQTLNRFGYRPHPLRETEEAAQFQRQERRRDLIRIGIAGACSGNIMIQAVSIYGGALGTAAQQFRELSAVLALPVLSYCAWPFYRSALSSLRARHLNLDVPIVVALIAGMTLSLFSLLRGTDLVYFDSLSMLVFLLLSSRFVLKGIQARQLQSLNLEDELLLASVERLSPNGEVQKVSSLSLVAGDLIRISEGSVLPVDGKIETGQGLLETAVLTGESAPSQVTAGSLIEAGSRHLSGEWLVRVINPPGQTRLAKILRETEKSAELKSHFVHFTDRVSEWFILLVFAAAALVILTQFSAHPEASISRALALLIVSCPCVFGMAIPLSMSFALRAAARRGIIVKSADTIERLWNAHALFFDKTGTLTLGAMQVLERVELAPHAFAVAYALEREQRHPIAQSLRMALQNSKDDRYLASHVHLLPTGGLAGLIDGIEYQLVPTNHENVTSITEPHLLTADFELRQQERVLARFQIGDQLRPETSSLIEWARNQNFSVGLLSGDRPAVVEACAQVCGLLPNEARSSLTPEAKAQILKSSGAGTVMVGDGANDANALAVAEVGIAVCGSLDVSLRAADVSLTRPDLNAIPELFQIACHTRTAIYRNLIFSASFNIISAALAIAGFMSPLTAAILMPVSSLTVLFSAVWTGNHLTQKQEKK